MVGESWAGSTARTRWPPAWASSAVKGTVIRSLGTSDPAEEATTNRLLAWGMDDSARPPVGTGS